MRNCKTWLLAAVILSLPTALTSTIRIAEAADLPVYRPPAQVAAAAYNWSGFYIGGHVGYAWGQEDFSPTGLFVFPGKGKRIAIPSASVDHNGFIGGATAGWNYQYGRIVLGVEGEASWSDMDDSTTRSFLFGKAQDARLTHSVNNNWIGTVAGRVGVAFDTLLYYGKFGVAIADNDYTIHARSTSLAFRYNSTTSETEVGWMVGAGIEWGFAPNWSAKIEGNYMDFGQRNRIFADIPINKLNVLPVAADIDSRIGNIKFGVNYRF